MSKGIREAPGKALIGELAAASGDRPEGAFGETGTFIPDCKVRAVLLCFAVLLRQLLSAPHRTEGRPSCRSAPCRTTVSRLLGCTPHDHPTLLYPTLTTPAMRQACGRRWRPRARSWAPPVLVCTPYDHPTLPYPYHTCHAAGLRQAMATAGALVGASIAGLAYKLSGQNYILTFALATIPATLALVITWTVRLPGHG